MSEVQKFKEYRKILKAQGGVKTSVPREETIGDWVREKNRSLFGSGMRWYNRNSPVERQTVAMEKETLVKDANGKEWILKPDGTKILASLRNPKPATTSSTSVAFSPISPEYRDEYKDKKETVQQSTTNTTTTKTGRTGRTDKSTVKVTPKGQAYWDSQYQDFKSKMTDDQKAWLAQRGIDYSSAQKMQEYLQRIGKSVGKFGADNKWGKNSQAAWENFVNTTMKNNPLQTPVEEKPEPVVDASDPFGYSTTNHYGDGMALKELGFNNYSGLKNYVIANQNNQFAKDLKQRFGNDVNAWNQTDVENALGVSGTYRGGYAGDFGDMARSMARWAGETNAAYDQREIASRTDSSGIVHNTTKLAQLFNKADASLKAANDNKYKLNIPNWDFTLKQGNIGAITLGDQPSLSKKWAGFDASLAEGII